MGLGTAPPCLDKILANPTEPNIGFLQLDHWCIIYSLLLYDALIRSKALPQLSTSIPRRILHTESGLGEGLHRKTQSSPVSPTNGPIFSTMSLPAISQRVISGADTPRKALPRLHARYFRPLVLSLVLVALCFSARSGVFLTSFCCPWLRWYLLK